MSVRIFSFRLLLRSIDVASLVGVTSASAAGRFPVGSCVQGPYTLQFERNGEFRVTKRGLSKIDDSCVDRTQSFAAPWERK